MNSLQRVPDSSPQVYKICTTCHIPQPRSSFCRVTKAKDGLNWSCKSCQRIHDKADRMLHRERINTTRRRWRAKKAEALRPEREAQRALRRTERRAYQQRWREQHREETAAYLRQWKSTHPTYMRDWFRGHPEVSRDHGRRRRARIAGTRNELTHDQWEAIITAWDNRCAYCGKRFEKLTQDHVIPLSKGGAHRPDNVVPACGQCNSGKRDRPTSKSLQFRFPI